MGRLIMKLYHRIIKILWDLWCLVSIGGIWPRYIEPYLLFTKKLPLEIKNTPEDLKILHFSDLHIHKKIPQHFLNKLTRKINRCNPDLILFTGDFLRFAEDGDKTLKRLEIFLNSLSAKHGCYAIFGNHDYQDWVSRKPDGSISKASMDEPAILKGFKLLFKKNRRLTTPKSRQNLIIKENNNLLKTLAKTKFQILHNSSVTIDIRGYKLNIVGLGEYWLDQCIPEKAFQTCNPKAPTIALLHNPDGVDKLIGHPCDLILSGHTHGGQVNLPWLWKKFTPIQNLSMKYGYLKYRGYKIFVTRGVGSSEPFRWFAPPEIALFRKP